MKLYKNNDIFVHAEQFATDNVPKYVDFWVPEDGGHYYRINTNRGWYIVHKDDWIIHKNDGSLEVIPDEIFKINFVEYKDLEPMGYISKAP